MGQGALAVECRSNDTKILDMLRSLSCLETQCRILTERSFLKTLGGGCSAPVAVQTELQKGKSSADDQNQIQSSNEYELSVTGAVWSLDGKTEIQALNKCMLDLEKTQKRQLGNISEVDHVPNKKLKLSISDEDNLNLLDSGKLSPPKIVDLSAIEKKDEKPIDLAGLINIHSGAFKKCPYSSVLTKDFVKLDLPKSEASTQSNQIESSDLPENLTTSNTPHSLKCPLHFSIGQDVMGQCPYVDTSNQHITQLVSETIDRETTTAEKCPFQKGNTILNADSKQQKCPFLSASTSKAETEISATLSNDNENEVLYCGLYRHKCWPLQIFERCEKLGKELANQLIEKGALKVMECAQNEIRKNI